MGEDFVIHRIRKALGRSQPLAAPPVPPDIDQALTRLVYPGADLVDRFSQQARAAAMSVEIVSAQDLFSHLETFLRDNNCRRIALPISPLLERLNLIAQLRGRNFDVHRWDQLTADQVFDFDCGITDVWHAVAETGSIVLRASVDHGRVLSLVPPFHIAILEASNIIPDLVDLFEKARAQGVASGMTIITGPSKTSDIEGQLVTGVHGPGRVHIFLLQ